MRLLDLKPGPDVGRAWAYLKELRLDRGPLERDEAEAELLRWWAEQKTQSGGAGPDGGEQ